jgi:hypothetical protein
MPDSKLLRCMKHLAAILQGANPDNEDPIFQAPYTLDLRGKVFRGRSEIGNEVEKPFMALNEPPKPAAAVFAGEGAQVSRSGRQVLVQGFAQEDPENPGDPAYELMAVAQSRLARVNAIVQDGMRQGEGLYPDDYLLGGKLTGFQILEGVVQPPSQQVSNTAFFYLPVVLELVTDPANPYAD